MTAAIPKRDWPISKGNAALGLVFFYFLTLSWDLIHLDVGVLKLKISHLAALAIFTVFAVFQKGIFLERRFFFSFLFILASMAISSFGSVWAMRGVAYSLIWVFTFFSYFVVPFNLMRSFDENQVLKIYFATYLITGMYAALQFFGSFLGFVLPFSVQKVIFVRGSALALEPSFYALYAIPFVAFMNSKWLLSKAYKSQFPNCQAIKQDSLKGVFFANLFLLVSTATSAFISYLVFVLVILFLVPKIYSSHLKGIYERRIKSSQKSDSHYQYYFSDLRKKLLKASLVFAFFFGLIGSLFADLFKKTFFKFFFFGLKHESFYDRLKGILASISVFFEHPFLGVGLGGVGPYLFQRDFFPNHQGQIADLDRQILEKFEPTNVVTEILASLGLLGFIAFASFAALAWLSIRKALKQPKLLPSERINLVSFFISTFVMLVCLQINQGLFRGYIWVHLALGVGYAAKVYARRQ